MPRRPNDTSTADARSWTIKKFPIEVREAAKVAARRDGKTMAAWLADVITLHLAQSGHGQPVPRPPENVVLVASAASPKPDILKILEIYDQQYRDIIESYGKIKGTLIGLI